MLFLDRGSGALTHATIAELPDFLDSPSIILFNNTRVRKARLAGSNLQTGGRAEFLLIRRERGDRWEAIVNKSRKHRLHNSYLFPDGVEGRIVEIRESSRILEFSREIDDGYLESFGHIPLPPYIKRRDETLDSERYQTVFSREPGSIAAPTAGLHFTDQILEKIEGRGIEIGYITLHVGIGTFTPVRTEEIENHRMHAESYFISQETADSVNRMLSGRGKVVAVGTTTVRALESAFSKAGIEPGWHETELFIYPGYRFRVVDEIVTNFHVPGSSLLMMIAAFSGREKIMGAYQTAIEEKYRFFSYGDVMYIR